MKHSFPAVIFALTLLFASLSSAQNLPADPAAEFTALKAQFQKQAEGIEATKASAGKTIATRYIAALDTAEKSATSGGKLNVVSAILAEKQAVETNASLAPAPSADLPKELGAHRSAYLRDTAQVAKGMAPKVQALALNYVRLLAGLEAKARAAKNDALVAEIGGEKLKAAAAAVPASNTTAGASGTASKNLVINGDFAKTEADGQPSHWETKGTAKVVSEGGQSFVRLTDRGCKQSFEVPKGAKTYTVSAKMRSADFVATPTGSLKGMSLSIMGKGAAYTGDWISNSTIKGPSKAWKKLNETKGIPPGVTEIELHLTRWDCVSATIDYDEVELSFK